MNHHRRTASYGFPAFVQGSYFDIWNTSFIGASKYVRIHIRHSHAPAAVSCAECVFAIRAMYEDLSTKGSKRSPQCECIRNDCRGVNGLIE